MPHEYPILPEFTTWPTFPFEGDLRLRPVDPPVPVEPPRQGEDPANCAACLTPDTGFLWVSARWRVRSLDRPTGLPMVLILESRSHLDLGDLPNLLAAELGVMTVRLERAVRSLEGVARVQVNRWGDGSAHLHVWFLARPYGQLQLRGAFLSMWDEVLPPVPEDRWRENLAYVAAWLSEFGGRSMVDAPHIDWQSPSTIPTSGASAPVQEPMAPAPVANEPAISPPSPESSEPATAQPRWTAATGEMRLYEPRPLPARSGESTQPDEPPVNAIAVSLQEEPQGFADSAPQVAADEQAPAEVGSPAPRMATAEVATSEAAESSSGDTASGETTAPAKKAAKPRKAAGPRKASPRKSTKKAAAEAEAAAVAVPADTSDGADGSAKADVAPDAPSDESPVVSQPSGNARNDNTETQPVVASAQQAHSSEIGTPEAVATSDGADASGESVNGSRDAVEAHDEHMAEPVASVGSTDESAVADAAAEARELTDPVDVLGNVDGQEVDDAGPTEVSDVPEPVTSQPAEIDGEEPPDDASPAVVSEDPSTPAPLPRGRLESW